MLITAPIRGLQVNKEVTHIDDRLEILLRLKNEVSQDSAAETTELLSLIDREVSVYLPRARR